MDVEILLRKSPFVFTVVQGDRAVIWHSLFGNPKIVSSGALELLNQFETPRSFTSFADEYEITPDDQNVVDDLFVDHFLIPNDFDERNFLEARMLERHAAINNGESVDYLELIMSEACNFRCTYCIHFNNLETSNRLDTSAKLMKFETATEIVDGYLAILRQHGKTTAEINFGGGEPLLAWPVLKSVLEYCRRNYDQQFDFRFSLNTNCSLITLEIAQLLKEHQVKIAASLDGLRAANDLVRITNSGRGTFDSITKGFANLAKVGYPLDGFAVTVNEHNFPEIDGRVIEWAAEYGMTKVRIDIDVIDMVNIPLETIVNRLMQIRSRAKELRIDVPGFWSRAVENLNFSPLKDHVAFCGAVRGNSMCVSPAGKIYPCGYSNTQIGDLANMQQLTALGGDYDRFVKNHLTGRMEMCRGCMIEGLCAGGCNITVEFARSTGTLEKIERMCDFYREMFRQHMLEDLTEQQVLN